MLDDWLQHWKELEAELESPGRDTALPSERAIEEQNRGRKDEGESAKNDQRGPSADFAALIDTIKSEGVAYRKEEQREDRGKKFREWITIGLIFVTFAAVCWQVHEMIKVYEPIRLQAEAAQKSAVAAKQQAEAMAKQAETSAKEIVAASRAWLGPLTATVNSFKRTKPSKGSSNIKIRGENREPMCCLVFSPKPIRWMIGPAELPQRKSLILPKNVSQFPMRNSPTDCRSFIQI